MKYGGNTSCIEVQAGDHRFVMDAGTGIRNFSKVVLNDDIRRTYLLLTHTHWDHINGFPFFTPAYDPKRTITIKAGHLKKPRWCSGGALNSDAQSHVPGPLGGDAGRPAVL